MRYIYQGVAKDGNGKVISSATVTPYLAGTTTAATIYSTSTTATASTYVSTSSNGSFYFYVDNKDYNSAQQFKIIISKSGYTSITLDEITIFPFVNYKNVTSVSSSGTGEDTLMSTSIAAGTIKQGGAVRITVAGTKTNANGNKTVKLYFGTVAMTINAAANDTNDWGGNAVVLNETAAAQRIAWFGTNSTTLASGYEAGTEDTTAAVTVKVTGECAHSSDVITQTMMLIEYL